MRLSPSGNENIVRIDFSKYRNLTEARQAAIEQAEYERRQEKLEALEGMARSRGLEVLLAPVLRALRQCFAITEIGIDDAVFSQALGSEEVTVDFANSSEAEGLHVISRRLDPAGSPVVQEKTLKSEADADRFASDIMDSRFG